MTNKTSQPLKKSTTGFEVEFLILDKTGRPSTEADKLLKNLAAKPATSAIVKECAKNMIEVGSYPNVEGADTMLDLLENLKHLVYAATEENLAICPLGTYPGAFTPAMRTDTHYKNQLIIHGKRNFLSKGRCFGYHCHYSLPWGVFDSKTLNLKNLINSKNQKSLVHAYNFLIAIDPALTTFMQSSPFYQGKFVAKDSRIVIYRGDTELPAKNSEHNSLFSELPSYETTGTDIINLTEKRYSAWGEVLKSKGLSLDMTQSPLKYNWSPVKVNPHGTLEQRGMDMNHLPILFAVSGIISLVLRHVEEEYYEVRPSDAAIAEPFKLEGKTILIPPDTYVKKDLQTMSGRQGLESPEIFQYCKRLVALVKNLEGKKINWLLQPLEAMLEKKRTVSDEIITRAKELGHKDLSKKLPQEIAAQIALEHSQKLFEEIILVEKGIEENKI